MFKVVGISGACFFFRGGGGGAILFCSRVDSERDKYLFLFFFKVDSYVLYYYIRVLTVGSELLGFNIFILRKGVRFLRIKAGNPQVTLTLPGTTTKQELEGDI